MLGRFFTISSYELNQLYEKPSNYKDFIPSGKPLLFFQNLNRNFKKISIVCLECKNKETDFAFISIKDKNISFIIQNNFFFEFITFSGKDLNLNFVESLHLSCYFEKEECCSLIECNYSNNSTYQNNLFLFKIMSGSLNLINTNFYNIEVYANSGYNHVFNFESVLNGAILTIRNSILKNLYFTEGLIKLCVKNVNLFFKNVSFLNYNPKGFLIDTTMLNIDNSSLVNFNEIKIINCKAKVLLFLNNSYFNASSIQIFDLNFSSATIFKIEKDNFVLLKNFTMWNIAIGSILNANRENKIIMLKNHIQKIKTFSRFSFFFSEANKIIIKESFYSEINCFDAFMNFYKNNYIVFAKNNFQLFSASNIVNAIPLELKGIIFFNVSNSCFLYGQKISSFYNSSHSWFLFNIFNFAICKYLIFSDSSFVAFRPVIHANYSNEFKVKDIKFININSIITICFYLTNLSILFASN